MYQQVVQLLTGARLIARPQGASIKELMGNLEISRKSVYRLFDALEELGYYLYPDKEGKEARYFLNREIDKMRYWQPLPTTRLNAEEHILLEFILHKISDNPAIANQIASLRKKLSMVIADCGYAIAINDPTKQRSIPLIDASSIPAKRYTETEKSVVSDIIIAIKQKRVCEVTYESFSSGSVKTYDIHPLLAFEHQGGLYAYVYQPYYEKVIILALERIQRFEIKDEEFTLPKGFDATKRISDPFGIILNGETFTAHIVFDEDQAPYIRERNWPEDTTIEDQEDGSILLKVKTAGAFELKKWILAFGGSADYLNLSGYAMNSNKIFKNFYERILNEREREESMIEFDLFMDEFETAPAGWIECRCANEMIRYLRRGSVERISLPGCITDIFRQEVDIVLEWLKHQVSDFDYTPPRIEVHSFGKYYEESIEPAIQDIYERYNQKRWDPAQVTSEIVTELSNLNRKLIELELFIIQRVKILQAERKEKATERNYLDSIIVIDIECVRHGTGSQTIKDTDDILYTHQELITEHSFFVSLLDNQEDHISGIRQQYGTMLPDDTYCWLFSLLYRESRLGWEEMANIGEVFVDIHDVQQYRFPVSVFDTQID